MKNANRNLYQVKKCVTSMFLGGWRRLYNEELHNLYASPNIDRVFKSEEEELDGECSKHRIDEKCIQHFGRKT
jgi:hypothetical protein